MLKKSEDKLQGKFATLQRNCPVIGAVKRSELRTPNTLYPNTFCMDIAIKNLLLTYLY